MKQELGKWEGEGFVIIAVTHQRDFFSLINTIRSNYITKIYMQIVPRF